MSEIKPYPGNTIKGRKTAHPPDQAEALEVKPVVTGNVIIRKKKIGKRIADFFFGSGNKNILQYAISEILIPAAKSAFYDMVTDTVGIRLFGENAVGRRHYNQRGRGQSATGTYVSYNSYNSAQPVGQSPYDPSRRNYQLARTILPDIVLGTKAEATEVIDSMRLILEQYDVVTVASLFSMLRQPPPPGIVANRFGWETLNGVAPVKVYDGWLLDLPNPIALE